MVDSWITYGLFAAVAFGLNAVIYKYASVSGSVNPFFASALFGAGIFFTFLVAYLLKFSPPAASTKSMGLIVLAGVVWALGFIMVAIAVSRGSDISRLAVIYNTNTLVAVVLGILVLKELPSASSAWKVILGSIFVVAGAILVSLK